MRQLGCIRARHYREELEVKHHDERQKTEERKVTSILRPSTNVPWSFSLAFSASALVSNVTKPKPCGQRGGAA